MSLEWIRRHYNVPAKRLGRVRYTGDGNERLGTITREYGGQLWIRLDGHNNPMPYHPTWKLEYLEGNMLPTDRDLIIPVNGVYFDQIKAGEKTLEFRLRNRFWAQRLERRVYRHVVLLRGYPKGGGVEGFTRLTRAWRGYSNQTITHPHFGAEPVKVFAIDVAVAAIDV